MGGGNKLNRSVPGDQAGPVGLADAGDAQRLRKASPARQVEHEAQNEELRRLRQALEESHARYLELYENAPVGYLTVSDGGQVESSNRTAVLMLGAEAGSLTGKLFAHCILSDDQDVYRRHYMELSRTGRPQQFDLRLLRSDGSSFWAHLAIAIESAKRDSPPSCRITVAEISSLKLVEEALRESEERFRTMFDCAVDGILVANAQDRSLIMGNKAMESMLMRRAEDIPKLRVDDIHPEKDLPIVIGHFESLARGDTTVARDVPLKRSDGSVVYCDIASAPVVFGGRAHLMGIFHDVTERRTIEAALRASEERIRTISDNLSSGMIYQVVRKPDGTRAFTYLSEAVHRLYGITPGEGMADASLIYSKVHREDVERLMMEEEETNRAMTVFRTEARILNPDGSIRWSSFVSNPRMLADGSTCWDGIEFDITDRKKAEEALCESEARQRAVSEQAEEQRQRLDTLLANMGEGVLLLDDRGRVVWMNAAAMRLHEFRTAEDALKKLQDFQSSFLAVRMDGGELPLDEWPAERALRGERVDSCVLRVTNIGSGKEWIGQYRAVPIMDESGKPVNVLLTISDITELKRAEEERYKTEARIQKLQRLDSLGILAGGIAHDFNNLLGGIFGYIGIAQQLLREGNADESAEAMVRAMSVFDRAKGLTQQLLTFARGGSPVRKMVQTAPLIERCTRFAASGSNVACRFEGLGNLWMCDCDESQVGQVIDNIVINALQAMPTGGVLTVSARNIGAKDAKPGSLPQDGEFVEMAFADTGIGIPANVLPCIFDPFFTTKSKGHGLGLATSHSIVRQHGGTIEVDSVPGKGTVFRVYLPAASSAVAQGEAPAGSTVRGKGGNVLLMDDEAYLRRVLAAILKNMGYTVTLARDGAEALRQFEEARGAGRAFVAILLDLTVPGGLGGKDVVREMRKVDPNVPVVALSGYSNDPVMTHPREFGFTDKLEKPFRNEHVSALMARVAGDCSRK